MRQSQPFPRKLCSTTDIPLSNVSVIGTSNNKIPHSKCDHCQSISVRKKLAKSADAPQCSTMRGTSSRTAYASRFVHSSPHATGRLGTISSTSFFRSCGKDCKSSCSSIAFSTSFSIAFTKTFSPDGFSLHLLKFGMTDSIREQNSNPPSVLSG